MKNTLPYLFALTGLSLLAAACGASEPSKDLMTARDAYTKLRQSEAAQANPALTRDAQQALDAAEAAHRDDAGSEEELSYSYVAARKSQIAMAQGEELTARQNREKAEQDYQTQLEGQLASTRQELASLQMASEKAKNENLGWRKKGETMVITLSGVSFDTNGHTLNADARKRLDAVAQFLKESPNRSITIAGYTDNKGNAESNRQLSQKRADSVQAYLEMQGVAEGRIASVGRGQSDPVASNNTQEGRADNRRVEITMHRAGETPPELQQVKGTDAPTKQGKKPK